MLRQRCARAPERARRAGELLAPGFLGLSAHRAERATAGGGRRARGGERRERTQTGLEVAFEHGALTYCRQASRPGAQWPGRGAVLAERSRRQRRRAPDALERPAPRKGLKLGLVGAGGEQVRIEQLPEAAERSVRPRMG